MRYTLKRDDMPLLSQWIKKSKSEDLDFLAGVAGFEPTMKESKSFALPLGDTPRLIFYLIDIIEEQQPNYSILF